MTWELTPLMRDVGNAAFALKDALESNGIRSSGLVVLVPAPAYNRMAAEAGFTGGTFKVAGLVFAKAPDLSV